VPVAIARHVEGNTDKLAVQSDQLLDLSRLSTAPCA
jgi:hypothetical protein